MRYLLSPASLIVALVVCAAGSLTAPVSAEPPASDHRSPESVVEALYTANSVQPGENHDWPRFRSLFAPGAHLMIRTRDGKMKTMTVEEFIAEATKHEGAGFVERELVHRTEKFGHIAHVWSSYEAVLGSGEGRQVMRGVNSFQLAEIEGRWLVTALLWETTRSGGELPADLSGN